MEVEPARILLIEDEPLNVELLQLALNHYKFVNQIDIVEDGEQALRYLLGWEDNTPDLPLPDLVLLDLRLPKIDGVQVLQAIRNHPRTCDLIVVVLTASNEEGLNACNTLEVSSYLVKPFSFEQLISVVRQTGLHWMLLKKPPLLQP